MADKPITESAERFAEGVKDLPPPPKAEEKGVSWPWWALPVAANLMDAASTQYGLSRNPGTTKEGNSLLEPFVRNLPLFLAAKGGLGLAEGALIRKLGKKRPGTAKAAAIGVSALPIAASVNNMLINPKKDEGD